MNIKETVSDAAFSIASILKLPLLSGIPSKAGKAISRRLIIMGNGPSLRETVDKYASILRETDTLAVNFAANTDTFFSLRPDIYVLADPHFFKREADGSFTDPNVERLWKNLSDVSWEMSLYIPCKRKMPGFIGKTGHIRIKRYNLTPCEGFPFISHAIYRSGLGMPRPRNVLIASLMIALREGYRDIAIVGADHTWSRDLWVDDRNRVISVQKHFYEDNSKEFERVADEYAGYHLHDILNSLTIAFRSYHQIAAYARTLGARITNCTPGSFIDAFPRGKLQ